MSMFLPEGFGQTQQPQDGVASITPSSPETTSEDIALMQRVLSAAMRNPNLIPSDFMAYIADYIQTQRLIIPLGQVFGYQNVASEMEAINTAEVITSTSSDGGPGWVDLATVGPKLLASHSRTYSIVFAAHVDSTSGRTGGSGGNLWASIALSIAGSVVASAEAATQIYTGTVTMGLTPTTVVGSYQGQVTEGDEIKLLYDDRAQFGTGAFASTFSNRWVLIL